MTTSSAIVGHRRPNFAPGLRTRLQHSRPSPRPTAPSPHKAPGGMRSPGESGRRDRQQEAPQSQEDAFGSRAGADHRLRQPSRRQKSGHRVRHIRAHDHPEKGADRQGQAAQAGGVSPQGGRGEQPETRGQARRRLRQGAHRAGGQAFGSDRRGVDRGGEGSSGRPAEPAGDAR